MQTSTIDQTRPAAPGSPGHGHRTGLIRSAAQLGLGTFASRLLGLGRDMSRAWLFGTGPAADAFTVAFRLPNLLRALFAEGALSAAFVPVLARYIEEKDRGEFEDFLHAFATIFLLCLLAVSLLGILLAPLVVPLIVQGFESVPGKIDLTVRLTQFLFPYILLISLATLMMAVLNCLGHFSAPAFSPALLNVAMILGALFVCPRLGVTPERQIYGLAGAVLVGGCLQVGIQLPPLLRRKIRPRLRWAIRHPGIRQVALLMLPGVVGIAAAEINVFVDTLMASSLEAGSVAALEYGQRVMQLPLGIFAVALGTAVLPALSRQAAAGQRDALRDTFGFSLRLTWLVLVPASVLLIVLARPILTVLFERGAFRTGDSLRMTTVALSFYSVGLCAYGSVKSLVPVFYAHQNTRYPVRCSITAMFANIALILVLMGPLRLGGLALATALASFLNVVLLFRGLRKNLGLDPPAGLVAAAGRFLAASLLGGCVAYACDRWIPLPAPPRLAAAGTGGILAYIVVLTAMGAEEPRDLWTILGGRLRRKG